MRIIKAQPSHHKILSSIAKELKAFWNYSKEWLELWDDDLTVSEDYILNHNVFYSEGEGKISGFYSYYPENMNVRLEHLFIHPKFIGKNIGKFLLEDFLAKIERNGFESVILDADPNAVGFYEKFGFEVIEKKPTKIKDRVLPVMAKKL